MSRCIFLFFALISSWAFVGHSQGLPGGDSLPCIQKLMPCQPYLKGSSSPPASCCAPLKDIVAGDSECLCAVFNNQDILKSLNVTQDDGLNLVKSCGANADTSICKKDTTPSGSPSTPAAPSTNSSTTAESPKSGAAAISHVGGYLTLATVLSLWVNSV
ncbi:hypothetical protein CDL12_05766 [Handroanthus impetiginosus]|uniref:Bifunctional inhibitor/plant lipid transfer protein/seed storage helical domain-containing protein n=1 Tax=Handroanthus impetiginosus TaxID=429701 RepID=A0A2G9HVI6_9LAMI|nr:hypothetical protein CDL12_05766 [Handroanthus impetiginosus]